VEAGSNLLEIANGDLVLIDRNQATLARDGIYLLDLPGLELRAVSRRPDDRIDVAGPYHAKDRSGRRRQHKIGSMLVPMEMSVTDLLGVGRDACPYQKLRKR